MTAFVSATVLEINRAESPIHLRLAASLAAKIAADLGARVIKVEPLGGDPVRKTPPHLDPSVPEGSALFEFLNTGKESVILDVDSTSGAAALAALEERADAVIREHAPAPDAKPGSRVDVHITGLGRAVGGGGAEQPASELTILAMSGLLDMIGDPARAPLRLGGHQAAYAGGLSAFTGMMAGLTGLRRTGRGEIVTVSLLDSMLWINWKSPAGAMFLGRPPRREGAQAEWQTIPCADGRVALVYFERDWPQICELARQPLLAKPPFAAAAERRRNRAAAVALLAEAFAGRTRQDIFAEAKRRRIPLGPVLSPLELLEDPQYLARDFIATVRHPRLGDLSMPHVPVTWNGRRFGPRPAPAEGTLSEVRA
ncbi:CoA transferase [Pikeienuella sp. HZG-20]|uniref:CoA transferase n=1 Tax=Paludibacillus litoralis TaxID=3133267 RepID=UPI0030EC0221